MFKITTFSLITILVGTLLTSCETPNGKRPSPLAMDSINISGTKLKIVYSSPSVRKRKIWGNLVPYGEVWGTGANEATYLETSSDLEINNFIIPKGSYAIFTIPTDTIWTIIFNKEWNQWGAYNYDSNMDELRLDLTPQKVDFAESLKFELTKESINFKWENLGYSIPIAPL